MFCLGRGEARGCRVRKQFPSLVRGFGLFCSPSLALTLEPGLEPGCWLVRHRGNPMGTEDCL